MTEDLRNFVRGLEQAGFDIVRFEDRTENMATMALSWLKAREKHEPELKEIEGEGLI